MQARRRARAVVVGVSNLGRHVQMRDRVHRGPLHEEVEADLREMRQQRLDDVEGHGAALLLYDAHRLPPRRRVSRGCGEIVAFRGQVPKDPLRPVLAKVVTRVPLARPWSTIKYA